MFCPECGQQTREDGNFCQHCGVSLSTSRSTVVRWSRRKALLISIVAIAIVLSSVFYFFLVRKGISGTYISQDPEKRIIELKKNNTFFFGWSGKWKVEAKRYAHMNDVKYKVVLVIGTDSVEVQIEDDRLTGETGFNFTDIAKREGAKPIKSSQGRLWNAYFDQESGALLEFKEDGTVTAGLLGKCETKGDTLTLYFKDPKSKEEPIKCEMKGNTITLNKMVFVKYRR